MVCSNIVDVLLHTLAKKLKLKHRVFRPNKLISLVMWGSPICRKIYLIVDNWQCDRRCYKASLTGTDGSGVGGHGGGGGQGGRGRGDGHGRSYRVPQTEPPWIFIYLLCVTGRVLEKIFVKKEKFLNKILTFLSEFLIQTSS